MSAQTTYNPQPAVATPGMIAQLFSLRQIDSYNAGAVIPFGVACSWSGAAGEGNTGTVVPSQTANAAVFAGVSVFAQELNPQAIGTGVVAYQQFDTLPVMSKGRVWVIAGEAVNAGDPAFAQVPANGQFFNDDGGSGARLNVNGKFMSTTTGAGQLVLLQLN